MLRFIDGRVFFPPTAMLGLHSSAWTATSLRGKTTLELSTERLTRFRPRVVATDGDQALLLGPSSIGGYLKHGYECLAAAYDSSGKLVHLPLDVVHTGDVPLLDRPQFEPEPQDNDAIVIEIAYPTWMTEPQDSYETDLAVYKIGGSLGLRSVQLAGPTFSPPKCHSCPWACAQLMGKSNMPVLPPNPANSPRHKPFPNQSGH